ncbi:MAG: pyridoxal-phosphate dependent enzyme [Bryobacterales bacterium]|nr:pyridoxal-phosphate dependent enzyme [Bryobacterales bacterium]
MKLGSDLWFKLESCNPTGSYKDRFIVREMERIAATGARMVVATSSGNTGAALAAYSARAGVRCVIVAAPEAPEGKLAQMRAHGACVVRVPRFTTDAGVTDEVMAALRAFSEAHGVPLVVSAFRYCPYGMEGVSGIAEELLALAPRHVFVPVGGGGLYAAVVRGFAGARAAVRVHAVQPAGCGTVVDAWRNGARVAAGASGVTAVSGLSVPVDIDATLALGLLRENGGLGIAVEDEEVFSAQRRLLREEGVFCEPAGAAAAAGWLRAVEEGSVDPAERAVCLVTGHGGKDAASIGAAAALVDSPLVAAGAMAGWLREAIRG